MNLIYDLPRIHHELKPMKEYLNLPKPTLIETKLLSGFQNSLRLVKSILMLAKKLFML